jgi:hypothetical protein
MLSAPFTMCSVVWKVIAPVSGLMNSMSTPRPFRIATVLVLVYMMSIWPCWKRPGMAAGAATAAALVTAFFSSAKTGSTLVSEPPNTLAISMIDTVPKVVWKPVRPSRST